MGFGGRSFAANLRMSIDIASFCLAGLRVAPVFYLCSQIYFKVKLHEHSFSTFLHAHIINLTLL